ncbi:MAG TPA: prolyl oligopeptidase family serine peptidase [Vicinamibacterales bacterium]|nr:prolyl oligopeptidase family serine peptidase [Vicinamibacterales bacterium]
MQKAFGTWPSPITAQAVAAQGIRLSYVAVDGDDIYWIEGRPHEAGRNALVRRRPDGHIEDVTPADFNVRTRVHEYGGGAYLVSGGIVYASNFADQRIYRIAANEPPVPVTAAGKWVFADATLDLTRKRLIAVREDHSNPDREAVTTLVSIPLDGVPGAGDVIASGYDFYSTPRLSPDGSRIVWLAWRHPQMPWDGTELWLADVSAAGGLVNQRCIAGGSTESIYQPGWTPDGDLYFVSDRDGWWTLYHSEEGEPVSAGVQTDAEFGRPQWIFGTSTWVPAGDGRMIVSYTRAGRWHLATLDAGTGGVTPLAESVEPREWLASTGRHVVLVAGSPTTPDAVVRIDLATGAIETLKSSSTVSSPATLLSVPESVEFPSSDGHRTHAFYYPPRHPDFTGLDNERPPLIVISHGGPTTATSATLDLKVQFWTSRGFAVADVNYGGSSGFGRIYRERLNRQWGVLDVQDMIAAAQYLVATGKADAHRLMIRGGSAGGYTTLAALTFHPGVFKAGASYYGISDIEVLAHDTHKFESRYLDTLVGPYPAAQDVYYARSPIHFVDRLDCSLILFQGLEDKVVPPNQSEMMAAAVRAKGLPVAYLAFEGEQHGFRKATTIVRCLEAELYFYGAIFGFTPADDIEPIRIDNHVTL